MDNMKDNQIEQAIDIALDKHVDEYAAPQVKGLDALPDSCFALLPSTGEIIRIDKGVPGYFPYTHKATGEPPKADQETIDKMNAEMGVTPEEADLMTTGSVFGWDRLSIQNYEKESKTEDSSAIWPPVAVKQPPLDDPEYMNKEKVHCDAPGCEDWVTLADYDSGESGYREVSGGIMCPSCATDATIASAYLADPDDVALAKQLYLKAKSGDYDAKEELAGMLKDPNDYAAFVRSLLGESSEEDHTAKPAVTKAIESLVTFD